MATQKPEHEDTDPALRERLKDEIMQGDKGGELGEWSARMKEVARKRDERHVDWPDAIKAAMKKHEAGESRSASSGGEASKQELDEQARQLRIPGRSKMSKSVLAKAVRGARP